MSLKGIQPAIKLIASDRMDKLLAKLDELCMISMGLLVQEEQSVGLVYVLWEEKPMKLERLKKYG